MFKLHLPHRKWEKEQIIFAPAVLTSAIHSDGEDNGDFQDWTKEVINAIPLNWCDPLLAGDKKVVGKPPYSCIDIENLLNATRERIKAITPIKPFGSDANNSSK